MTRGAKCRDFEIMDGCIFHTCGSCKNMIEIIHENHFETICRKDSTRIDNWFDFQNFCNRFHGAEMMEFMHSLMLDLSEKGTDSISV